MTGLIAIPAEGAVPGSPIDVFYSGTGGRLTVSLDGKKSPCSTSTRRVTRRSACRSGRQDDLVTGLPAPAKCVRRERLHRGAGTGRSSWTTSRSSRTRPARPATTRIPASSASRTQEWSHGRVGAPARPRNERGGRHGLYHQQPGACALRYRLPAGGRLRRLRRRGISRRRSDVHRPARPGGADRRSSSSRTSAPETSTPTRSSRCRPCRRRSSQIRDLHRPADLPAAQARRSADDRAVQHRRPRRCCSTFNEEGAYIDDVELTTDPACPAQ